MGELKRLFVAFTAYSLLILILFAHVEGAPEEEEEDPSPRFNLKPYIRLPPQPVVFEHFLPNSCALQERSIGNELYPITRVRSRYRRKILRFSVVIENEGPHDLIVGPPKFCNREEDSTCLWEWGACHRHYHFIDFTNYQLYQIDRRSANSDSSTVVVISTPLVTGRKQAFCLMDIEHIAAGREGRRGGRGNYTCGRQGISAGWADVYGYWLDGQWLDVTGVRPGLYILCVTVDHGNAFKETNENDNQICIRVRVPRYVRHASQSDQCLPEQSNCVAGGDSSCCSGDCVEANNTHRCTNGLECLSESDRCQSSTQCCDHVPNDESSMHCCRQTDGGPRICRFPDDNSICPS